MAKVSDVFGSKGLKAEDLQGQDVAVTIRNTRVCKFDDGDKIEVQFEGKEKSLVCNKTNANTIALVLKTDDLDFWIGGQITLYPAYVDFRGEQVLAIRVRPPAVAASPAPQQAAAAPDPLNPPPPDDDGSIPF